MEDQWYQVRWYEPNDPVGSEGEGDPCYYGRQHGDSVATLEDAYRCVRDLAHKETYARVSSANIHIVRIRRGFVREVIDIDIHEPWFSGSSEDSEALERCMFNHPSLSVK